MTHECESWAINPLFSQCWVWNPLGTQIPSTFHSKPVRPPTVRQCNTWYLEIHLRGSPYHSEDYGVEEIPSRDLVIRLLFQKVQKMKDDRTCSQELEWGKLRSGPFTKHIKNSRHDKDVQALRIPFQSALGCKRLSDKGQSLLFPSALTRAALNWFYDQSQVWWIPLVN